MERRDAEGSDRGLSAAAGSLRCHLPRLRLACTSCHTALEPSAGGLACPACATCWTEADGILVVATGGDTARGTALGYDPRFFPGIEEIEERHFWFRVRRRLLLDRLRRDVPDLPDRALFDIGCGTGGLLAFLERGGVTVAGACDVHLDALERARRRLTVPLLLLSGPHPPPLAEGQSLISMFDVLEHIDDDRGTLAWLASVLAPGGVLVLTVPAHPSLYDWRDRLYHHRRRYRRRELAGKLREAGFELRRLEHFMACLVLPKLAGRLVSRGSRAAAGALPSFAIVPVVNGVAHLLLEAERRLTARFRPPFGTSLLAVATRR